MDVTRWTPTKRSNLLDGDFYRTALDLISVSHGTQFVPPVNPSDWTRTTGRSTHGPTREVPEIP